MLECRLEGSIEEGDRGDTSLYMTEVGGLSERVNSCAAGCWDD